MNGKNIFKELFENDLDAAKYLFKMYESFVKAGFDKTQAFYLTSEILKGGYTMNEKNIFKETCEDVAKDLFKMYESFVKAGFNKTQAFYLTSEILKGGLKNGKNSIE